jgi:glycosyltransferase involved in cell wall biosynthesis
MDIRRYVLVTAAKNEEGYIERTIGCVVSQTVLPLMWVIVDDGSTDRTAAIVESLVHTYPWMRIVRRQPGLARTFSSKAMAFEIGRQVVSDFAYDYLGNLDADVCLPSTYYEQMLALFESDGTLGIVGGKFSEIGRDNREHVVTNSPDSVRGAVQLFRKKCFEDVGGYIPLPRGGIDSAAEIIARMKGWKVRTSPDAVVLHLRPTGGGMGSSCSFLVRRGMQDRSLGYQGIFEAARCIGRMKERPFVIGGLSVLAGFVWAWIRGENASLSPEVVGFLRREQKEKLAKKWQAFRPSRTA